MPKISEELLTAISNNTYQDSVLDLSISSFGNERLDEKSTERLANALATNTHIKTVNLKGNKIGPKGAAALAKITTLTSLNLFGNKIGDEGAMALKEHASLTQLNVGYNGIGLKGAAALAKIKTLNFLDIIHNNIGDEGAMALAGHASLTQLSVEANGIGLKGVKALAKNTALTSLNLSSNNIDYEGATALAANTTLTLLGLSDNRIGDEGAAALAANTTLTTLYISGNRIGIAGVKGFMQNKTLTDLALHDNLSYDNISLDKDIKDKLEANNAKMALKEHIENAIEDHIAKNKQRWENWLRVASLLTFVRANCDNQLKTSVLPLIPGIAKFVAEDEKHSSHKATYINLSAFFDTRFFKQMAAQPNPHLFRLEDKSEKLPTVPNNSLEVTPAIETENAKKQTVEAKTVVIDNKQTTAAPFLSAQAQTTDNPLPSAKMVMTPK